MAERSQDRRIPNMTDVVVGAAYPLGTYLIEVTGVEFEAENRFSDAPRVRIEMAVIKSYQTTDKQRLRELMIDGEPLCAWCNFVFSPRSRLKEIAEPLMGRTYGPGESPGDLDVLIGKRAIVSVVKHVKTIGPNAGEETTKVGAFQPLPPEEQDDEPASVPVTRPRPQTAGDRVVASSAAMSGKAERQYAPVPEPDIDELDAFAAPNKPPRSQEGAPPLDADAPGAVDADLRRKQAAARARAPY